MKEKNHNYFYKITNLVNGKYYYGIRSTDKEIEEDRYMGSGMAIEKAIAKYGKENFTKEIIADYPTRKEASDHEMKVVTLELVESVNCYNLRTGGDNEYSPSEETRKKMSKAQTGKTGEKSHNFGKIRSIETKLKLSELNKGKMCGENHHNFGKSPSNETRQKMRDSHKGNKNPNFGKPRTDDTKSKIKNSQPAANKCIIFGVSYSSIMEASRQLNLSHKVIRYRIKSNKSAWVNWNNIT